MNSFVQSGPHFNTTFDFRVWPAVFYCRELMKTFYSFYRFYIISEHARFSFRYPFLAHCQPRFRQKHNVCFCNIWLRIGHLNVSRYDDFSWDRQYEYFFLQIYNIQSATYKTPTQSMCSKYSDFLSDHNQCFPIFSNKKPTQHTITVFYCGRNGRSFFVRNTIEQTSFSEYNRNNLEPGENSSVPKTEPVFSLKSYELIWVLLLITWYTRFRII